MDDLISRRDALRAELEALKVKRDKVVSRMSSRIETVEAKLKAFEVVVRDVHGETEAPVAGSVLQFGASPPGSVMDGVRRVVMAMHRDRVFDLTDVRAVLESNWPQLLDTVSPDAVSTALSRLSEVGGAFIVEPGKGRRRAKYRTGYLGPTKNEEGDEVQSSPSLDSGAGGHSPAGQ